MSSAECLSLCLHHWAGISHSLVSTATSATEHQLRCLVTEVHACMNNLPEVDSRWSQFWRGTSCTWIIDAPLHLCCIQSLKHSNAEYKHRRPSFIQQHVELHHHWLSAAGFWPLRTRAGGVFTMRRYTTNPRLPIYLTSAVAPKCTSSNAAFHNTVRCAWKFAPFAKFRSNRTISSRVMTSYFFFNMAAM